MTAEELLSKLASDPAYQRIRLDRQREHAEFVETIRDAEKSFLLELGEIGIDVDGIWKLIEHPPLPKCAVDLLLDFLKRPIHDRVGEGVARALANVQDRSWVWETLIEHARYGDFSTNTNMGLWAAISELAGPSDLSTLIALIRDPALGQNRVFLVRNLMRSKKHEARAVLEELSDDPDLKIEIGERLSKSRRTRSLGRSPLRRQGEHRRGLDG